MLAKRSPVAVCRAAGARRSRERRGARREALRGTRPRLLQDRPGRGGRGARRKHDHVTLLRTVVARNRAAPSHTVPSVKATCPDGPCPASFGDAAGIDNWGTMRLIKSVVRDNHASGAQSQGGGIVSEAGASLALEHPIVAGNRVEAIAPYGRFANGGGIFVADGAGATIRHSQLDDNVVTVHAPLGEPFGDAAALCSCTGLPLTISDTSIAGNRLTVHVLSSDDNGPSGPAALDSGGPTTILRTRITGNHATIVAPTGGAGTLAAIGFFSGGTEPVIISDSAITSNRVAAVAPARAATVQGAGITNAGALALDDVTIRDNHGTATGLSGFAQGGGIFNGEIFGIPTAPPKLRHAHVTGNVLRATPGIDAQGGGLFTVGFPPVLTASQIAGNLPDQCAGC